MKPSASGSVHGMNGLSELTGVSFMVQVGLAAAYGYVYLLYRRPAFLWYSCAWLSAAGFAIVQRVYITDPQINLLLNIEQQCVLGVCLLIGVTYLGTPSRSVAVVGGGGLVLGTVSLAIVAAKVEVGVLTHIGNVLVVAVAAVMWLNAMRFVGMRYDRLLDVLRPEPMPLSTPALGAKSESELLPAWRELRLTRRLLVFTFAALGNLCTSGRDAVENAS